jgi:aminopeptidase N
MPMRTETPQPIHLKDYQPSPWLIDQVELDVRLDPVETRVKARLAMRPNPKSANPGGPIVLDGEALTFGSASLDGTPLTPEQISFEDGKLTLGDIPSRAVSIEISSTCNPQGNSELSGLYLTNGIYCTQCEAEGFRRITYFMDRPDVLARYRVRIEADKAACPVLLSNGNLLQTGDIDGSDRHFAVWEDPHPKPSYLFALVAGTLAHVADRFTTRSGREVGLRIYVEPGKEDRCAYAMESLKHAMRWDEEAFGREYDLDLFMIVAVSDFNMGAMENKGLNVFNDKYILALPNSATDADYTNIEGIIAHEYFHNWTGNRITCRDWFQLCLKEGLTVFRDQEFTADVRSRPVKRISDVRLLRTHQFPEDAGPLAHPVRPSSYIEINNFYTATVYEKGAELCRMLKTVLGAEAFRKGMDLYFERHDGEAAAVEDFVRAMADASGRDLKQFFRWYEQAGTPEVIAEGAYDKTRGSYTLTLTQTTPATPGQTVKAPFHIPLAIGLVGKGGEDLPLKLDGKGPINRQVIELTERTQSFRFTGLKQRPVLSVNRAFSAPIKLASNLTDDDLLFLMAHDGDSFNRWEAGQTIARKLIMEAMPALKDGAPLPDPSRFAAALGASLDNRALEPAFVALMLSPPGEGDIAGEIGRDVDTDLVHRAREWLRGESGKILDQRLLEAWKRAEPDPSYSPDPLNAGRRALRHGILGLLAAADPDEGASLALEHFAGARNMTDVIGALSVLIQIERPEREEALDRFYEKHRSDHLLVDKWLALNAQVPSAKAARRVRALMGHSEFTLARPNRVRALIGTFAGMNPVGFNAVDGAGYDLLASVVEALDPKNPQLAARLAGNFKSYKVLEERRRQHAETALKRIAAASGLSRDTYEIVTRTLGET